MWGGSTGYKKICWMWFKPVYWLRPLVPIQSMPVIRVAGWVSVVNQENWESSQRSLLPCIVYETSDLFKPPLTSWMWQSTWKRFKKDNKWESSFFWVIIIWEEGHSSETAKQYFDIHVQSCEQLAWMLDTLFIALAIRISNYTPFCISWDPVALDIFKKQLTSLVRRCAKRHLAWRAKHAHAYFTTFFILNDSRSLQPSTDINQPKANCILNRRLLFQ